MVAKMIIWETKHYSTLAQNPFTLRIFLPVILYRELNQTFLQVPQALLNIKPWGNCPVFEKNNELLFLMSVQKRYTDY